MLSIRERARKVQAREKRRRKSGAVQETARNEVAASTEWTRNVHGVTGKHSGAEHGCVIYVLGV